MPPLGIAIEFGDQQALALSETASLLRVSDSEQSWLLLIGSEQKQGSLSLPGLMRWLSLTIWALFSLSWSGADGAGSDYCSCFREIVDLP